MAYAKFRGDSLFTGREMLHSDYVLIMDVSGRVEGIVPASEAGDDIREVNGMICPGFVNTHCHLELSHMKGLIPEGTGLVGFVTSVMQQRHFSAEKIAAAIAEAETQMLEEGIVAVGDICNTTHSIAQKTKGRLQYYNFVEVSGFVPAGATARLEQAAQHQQAFAAAGLHSVITPHAPYSVSDTLFGKINELGARHSLSVHNQETPEEDAFFRNGVSGFRELYDTLGVDLSFYQPPGCTSLQHWLPLLDAPSGVLLVHNTCSSATDIGLAQALANRRGQQLYWTLCPNANMYIEERVPPVKTLQDQGCTITIGTDSLASNHQLSVLAELRTLYSHFPDLLPEEMLQWATLNGATALQLADTLGSFDTGKRPGVLEIERGWRGVRRLL